MSGSPNIARPRPVSTLNRPTRRSTGSAPQEIHRSVKAAVRKISTVSMPSIDVIVGSPADEADCLFALEKAAPLSPALGQGGRPQPSVGDLNPSLTPVNRPAGTPPQSPLSPVFSAVSSEPLQPQQIKTSTSRPPSTREATSPTHSPPPSSPDVGDAADKYAALANLDCVFTDPAKAPVTTINWRPSTSEEDESGQTSPAAAAEVQPGQPAQGRNGGCGGVIGNSPGGSRPTAVGGSGLNVGTGSSEPPQSQPFPASSSKPPSTSSPPAHAPDLVDDHHGDVGDKYAALARLDSAFSAGPAHVHATAINWGSSQPAKEESEETPGSAAEPQASGVGHQMYGRNGGVNRNGGTGSAGNVAGVTSSSPPRSIMAAQPQMYSASAQPVVYGAQVTVNSPGYIAPAAPYSNIPGTPHPGYVPTHVNSNAYVYPQHPAQYSNPFSAVVTTAGFPGVPANPAMTPPQAFPGQGSVWGHAGNPVAQTSSSTNPFVAGGQLQNQVPMCLS